MKKTIFIILLISVKSYTQTKIDYPTQLKNMPIVVDTTYTTIQQGCDFAATYHAVLNVTKQWNNVPTTHCNAVVNFVGSSARIEPANAAIFFANGYTAPSRQQVWLVDTTGVVRITGPGTGSPIFAQNFSTLASACDTAVVATSTLTVSAPVGTSQIAASFSCAANIYAEAGGIMTPASGQTVTLTGTFDGALTQHFDLSAGGLFDLTGSAISAIYPQWFGAVGDGTTNDTVAFRATFGVAGKAVAVPPQTYNFGNSILLASAIVVKSASVYAEGAAFTGGGLFSTVGSPNGLSWIGGTFDTTAISGTGGAPVFFLGHDHQSLIDTHFNFTKNYTAIQIAGQAIPSTVDDVNIDGITTTTTQETHITIEGATHVRINNWHMDGGDESGLVIQPLADPIDGVTVTNVTGNGVADLLQIAGATYAVSNIVFDGWTCTNCLYAIETQPQGIGVQPQTNIDISHGEMIDLSGTLMTNIVNIAETTAIPRRNWNFSNINGYGCFDSSTSGQGWFKITSTNAGAIFDHFMLKDMQLTTPASCSGSIKPGFTFVVQNNANWTNWVFDNINTNGATGPCLSLTAAFATQSDLIVRNSHFSGCQGSSASEAHDINNLAIWDNNQTVLNASQPEIVSTSSAHPQSISYATMTGNTWTGKIVGTTVHCYDCQPLTPAFGGGSGATCTLNGSSVWVCGNAQYYATNTTGSTNNHLVVVGGPTLVDNVIFWVPVPVTLQVGVNDLVYNGAGALPIYSNRNFGNNIATAWAVNGRIPLNYHVSCGCFADLTQ